MRLMPEEVAEICKVVAPKFLLDPLLVQAVCLQESAYDASAMRLENGFFRKYTRNLTTLSHTERVLMATSWGLMQVMGLNLMYLKMFAPHQSISSQIDSFMVFPNRQVEYGCRWLYKCMVRAGQDVNRALYYYNGSWDYPPQVMAKYKKLKGE